MDTEPLHNGDLALEGEYPWVAALGKVTRTGDDILDEKVTAHTLDALSCLFASLEVQVQGGEKVRSHVQLALFDNTS